MSGKGASGQQGSGGGKGSSGSSGSYMTKADSSRIQSSQATGGRDVGKGSFAARAQSAGDRNTNSGGSKAGGGKSK